MKKKKMIALLLAAACTFALAGCGESKTDETLPAETEASETEETEVEVQETEEASEPDIAEEDGAESEETESEAAEGAETSSAPEDLSSAVEANTSTDSAPIPLGQWATVARYATEDETYHNVYMRITKVVTSSEDAAYIQEAVDMNNELGSDWDAIDLTSDNFEVPDDVEFCVVEYDVYVPEDFPAPDHGMVEPTFSIIAEKVGGGGIPSADGGVYLGLGANFFDLVVYSDDTKFEPGNLYSFRHLFTMVKGYQDYVFTMTSYPDGTHSDDNSVDTMYYAYFANK